MIHLTKILSINKARHEVNVAVEWIINQTL